MADVGRLAAVEGGGGGGGFGGRGGKMRVRCGKILGIISIENIHMDVI